MTSQAASEAISEQVLANAIRALSMDAVQQAKSGHPGAPMGMADFMQVLWNRHLKHNPANPEWPDRDRFVLSNGHASMLLYSLLHLSGYDLSIEEIRDFRQLGSATPGHPEVGDTPGVETTTGPLGQGITNAVGMALAEKMLAAEFNRPGHEIVDHHTYVALGDGCLMEGISHEACSLAGTLGLAKLIALYDDNGISIDGEVDPWFSDDTVARFTAYGWHVVADIDGHDPAAVDAALTAARAETARPSLLCLKTVIGAGSPNKQGTAATHGAPLGDEEIAAVRERIDWPHPPFEIPQSIYEGWNARARGAAAEQDWQTRFDAYAAAHAQAAEEFTRRLAGDLPADFATRIGEYIARVNEEQPKLATRQSSQKAIEACAALLPEMVGGSADLTGSNGTRWGEARDLTRDDASGRYVNYGVREFGMSAIMNGMALHGGFIPFAGTFLVFSDYARNAIRLAALMHQRCIFVYTHDSIGLGEDGPTHQAIEHTSSLRLMPNLDVWRPCDALETAIAWQCALERDDGPSAMVLTRQGLPPQATRSAGQLEDLKRGAAIVLEPDNDPSAIIIATGSEVDIAVQAAKELNDDGHAVRVVSMPCADRFDAQDEPFRNRLLPPAIRKRVAVEAGATGLWHRYVGLDGDVVGMDRFGLSAPGGELFEHFNITADAVAQAVRALG